MNYQTIDSILTVAFFGKLKEVAGVTVSEFINMTNGQLQELTKIVYGGFPVNNNVSCETDSDRERLGELCAYYYKNKWEKIVNALSAEYNPINNYDMVETSHELTDDGKKTTTTTPTGGTENEYSYTSGVNRIETNTGVSTFDSNAKNRETVVQESTPAAGYKTTNRTLQGTKNETTEEHTAETVTHFDKTLTADNVKSVTLSRSGNIGVTTSSQLVQNEVELRNKNIFANIFIRDCAEFIGGGAF